MKCFMAYEMNYVNLNKVRHNPLILLMFLESISRMTYYRQKKHKEQMFFLVFFVVFCYFFKKLELHDSFELFCFIMGPIITPIDPVPITIKFEFLISLTV